MLAEYTRDAAATAAVCGFFASSWFGWAQARLPAAGRKLLIAGVVFSLLVAVAGAALTWRYWSTGTAFNQLSIWRSLARLPCEMERHASRAPSSVGEGSQNRRLRCHT